MSLVKFDNLRYRLVPYIYSLAWQVTDGGYNNHARPCRWILPPTRKPTALRPVYVGPGHHGLPGHGYMITGRRRTAS